MVPSSAALTWPAALGAALLWSTGQAAAQAPLHADWSGWSFSNRYSVRPLASTRIVPPLELAVLTVAALDCPLLVEGALPYAPPPPPELDPPEPELLLLHPAAIAPAAASATSATTGRRMNPILLGRDRGPPRPPSGKLLVTDQTRMSVPQSGDPSPATFWRAT